MPDTKHRQLRKLRLKLKRERMFRAITKHKQRRGCVRCKKRPQNLEFDHIIPRYLGGRPRKPVTRSPMRWWRAWLYMIHPNIQVMCHPCHKIKTHTDEEGQDVSYAGH